MNEEHTIVKIRKATLNALKNIDKKVETYGLLDRLLDRLSRRKKN